MKQIRTISAFRKQLQKWLIELQEVEAGLVDLELAEPDVNWILSETRRIALNLGRADIAKVCLGDEYPAEIVAVALALLDSRDAMESLTVAETAQRFNLSERTIYRLVEDGLPHLKARGAIRIKPSDLANYLEQQGQPEPVRASLFD